MAFSDFKRSLHKVTDFEGKKAIFIVTAVRSMSDKPATSPNVYAW